MNRIASALAMCAVAAIVSCAIPAFAAGPTGSSTTDSGVQVIDMNAPPSKLAKKAAARNHAPPTTAPAATQLPGAATLMHNALAYIGAPFRMGGTTPAGFDCSGFTQFAFATIGVRIPRTADQQFYGGKAIVGDPLPGDLLFFQTYAYGPSHVAIYLGNGQFVNAIGKDVHVDSFSNVYFKSRYLGARRFL
jgi:cell wall-associated NlpC family hydrolase